MVRQMTVNFISSASDSTTQPGWRFVLCLPLEIL